MNKKDIEWLIQTLRFIKGSRPSELENVKANLMSFIQKPERIDYLIHVLEEDIKVNDELDKFFGGKDGQ